MDKPMLYELNRDSLGFQFRIRHDASRVVTVNVKVRSYNNRDMIQLLKERAGSMQQAKDDLDAWDVKEGSAVASKEFFDKYILEVKLNGTVLTPDQVERLDARYDIKNMVIEHGYNGIYRIVPPAETELQKLGVEEILSDSAILTRFSMLDETEVEQSVKIPHFFTYPNAMDSLAWDRASVQQGLRQGGFRVQYNHEALNTLYNRMIQSVYDTTGGFGIVLDGEPCVKENKEQWIDKEPYLFKRAALGFLFTRAERAVRGNE